MAWKEQCKIAFRLGAEGMIHQRGGKGTIKVLRQLSRESDIPFKTLERWFYEKDLKNEDNSQGAENSTQNNQTQDGTGGKRLICETCGERNAERKKKDGKWYYYKECHRCREMGTPAYEKNAHYLVICPQCGNKFKIKKEHLIIVNNENKEISNGL